MFAVLLDPTGCCSCSRIRETCRILILLVDWQTFPQSRAVIRDLLKNPSAPPSIDQCSFYYFKQNKTSPNQTLCKDLILTKGTCWIIESSLKILTCLIFFKLSFHVCTHRFVYSMVLIFQLSLTVALFSLPFTSAGFVDECCGRVPRNKFSNVLRGKVQMWGSEA